MHELPKIIHNQQENTFWPYWLRWSSTSSYLAILAETRLLNRVNSIKEILLVPVLRKDYYIRTLCVYKNTFMSVEEKIKYFDEIPIVLLHGIGTGLAIWCKNLDSLAEDRQVYAIDLLGFGNSSRPKFSEDPNEVENAFIQSIEDWRKYMNLKKIIIIGHSFGAYIGYLYGIKYGHNLSQIILVDPWGFREYQSRDEAPSYLNWALILLNFLFKYLNPLFPIRFLGPFAPFLLRIVRQDLGVIFKPPKLSLKITEDNLLLSNESKHSDLDNDQNEKPKSKYKQRFLLKQSISDFTAIYDYVYYCNTQRPSGESAFKCLSSPIGWAARPLIKRINDLNYKIIVTFIYGGKSWMDWKTGYQAQYLRSKSRVNVKVLDDAGHYVFAEACNDFDSYVNSVCGDTGRHYSGTSTRRQSNSQIKYDEQENY